MICPRYGLHARTRIPTKFIQIYNSHDKRADTLVIFLCVQISIIPITSNSLPHSNYICNLKIDNSIESWCKLLQSEIFSLLDCTLDYLQI